MSNLEDLNYISITEMLPSEALELIRSIRMNRRIPSKPKTKSKQTKKPPNVSQEDAIKLLKILGGNQPNV